MLSIKILIKFTIKISITFIYSIVNYIITLIKTPEIVYVPNS